MRPAGASRRRTIKSLVHGTESRAATGRTGRTRQDRAELVEPSLNATYTVMHTIAVQGDIISLDVLLTPRLPVAGEVRGVAVRVMGIA